jgi:hypothetical protein
MTNSPSAGEQTEIFPGVKMQPAGSSGFWTRLLKRSRPYWLPLALLDVVVVYYFSRHLSLAKAADGMVAALDKFHARDPRIDGLIADAQALLGKSILALLVAAAGALLCIGAVAGLCWSARCLRKRKRLAAELDAILWAEGKPTPVMVVDISEGGCRISVGTAPECGTSVRVAFGEAIAAEAKVVWRTDRHAGLQFSGPLTQSLSRDATGSAPGAENGRNVGRDLQILKGCRSTASASAWRLG